ncbi:hypothetical protein ACFQAS_11745 [Halopenitus salinus]|jgi:hypothetical protein|uniref:Uncharacterized protein n=1 Tax=Halopenitus salinus TaxID=1198295 RepID=A0ABD5UT92_9EURY
MKASSETGVISQLRGVIAQLRRPEYTGENRCLPCTILNVAIAIVLSIGAGYVAMSFDLSPFGIAAATLIIAVAAIYLRGYLIPGTPTLTKRYFPDRVLAWFEKGGQGAEGLGWDGESPEALLIEIGIVVDDPSEEDLVLDRDFERAWTRSIHDHWNDEATIKRSLGTFVDADPDVIEFEAHSRSFLAWADDAHLASWPSRAACVADAAAATELPRWDPDWERRPLSLRAEILGALRLFLERCPACDGEVVLSQDVVESCCRSRDVVTATCRSCDSRLFELDVDPAELPDQ